MRSACGSEYLAENEDCDDRGPCHEIIAEPREERLREQQQRDGGTGRAEKRQASRLGDERLQASLISRANKAETVGANAVATAIRGSAVKIAMLNATAKMPASRVLPVRPSAMTAERLIKLSATMITVSGNVGRHQFRPHTPASH